MSVVDDIDPQWWELVRDKYQHFEDNNVRYVVRGRFERLSEQQLRVEVSLEDRQEPAKNDSWNRDLSNELGRREGFFRQVAGKIRTTVDGLKASETIFTYCFKPLVDDATVIALAEKLPFDLRDRLKEQLGAEYQVATSVVQSIADEECARSPIKWTLRPEHDYNLYGEVLPAAEPGMVKVALVVRITTPKVDSTLSSFHGYHLTVDFLQQLAAHVVEEWGIKMAPQTRGRNR